MADWRRIAEELRLYRSRLFLQTLLKGIFFGLLTGGVVGLTGGAFRYVVALAGKWFGWFGWLIYLLPVGGAGIALLYKYLAGDAAKGTNLVLESAREATCPPVRMAPLIFVATTITHLLGGSVGREGAALQFGSSITGGISRLLHMDEANTRMMVLCGMAAGFSAMFGTPAASAVFAMEIVSVGVMYYGALVPCMISSVLAWQISSWIGGRVTGFTIGVLSGNVDFSLLIMMRVVVLSLLCGALSALFWRAIYYGSLGSQRLIPDPVLRALIGGAAVTGLTLLLATRAYNGTSAALLAQAIAGNAHWYDFLLKTLFTVLTIAAGFKGGEIIPTMVVGAAFGAAAGPLLGLDPSLSAAIGLASLFCGVTNAPLAAIVLCMELFGAKGLPFFALAVAVSYQISGNGGLYSAQKIVSNKLAMTRKEDVKGNE